MTHYVFSTFPLNQGFNQHKGLLSQESEFFECSLLASYILGVDCSDTVYGDKDAEGKQITFYQITPDPHEATTKEEEIDYEAFNNYFYANYGQENGKCHFETPHEAFYNLVKAWFIWKHHLEEQTKNGYLTLANKVLK